MVSRLHLVALLVWKTFGQVVLPPGTLPIVNPKDPCVEIQNVSDVVSLPQHKYMVLEHCLYYDIQRRIDQKYQQVNAIAMLPPSSGEKQTNITVVVHGVTLQNIWLNDMMKDLHIRGFFDVSWSDPRVNWEKSKWRINTLTIQTASHIWVPQITSQKYVSSVANGDFTDYKRIRASNGGNISAYMNFNLQTFCDVDLENFPSDIHSCCFHLQPKLFHDLTTFRAEGTTVKLDKKAAQTNIDIYSDPIPFYRKFEKLISCLNAKWITCLSRTLHKVF